MRRVLYKLRNWRAHLDKFLVKLFCGTVKAIRLPVLTSTGEVHARKWIEAEGRWEDLGLLSCRLVTDAGVAFLVDDWDNDATDITTMNWHDSGTGTNAEAVGDTALQTPTAESRDSGTKSQPAANQLQSVATHTYAGTFLFLTNHSYPTLTP